jgi:hypothetical protein
MEVATAAAVSSILTLALVVASSIGAEIFRDNGITITSLWSLWTTVLALDSNWYYFMRLKSVENSIRLSHFQMINCCKHDFLYALSAGSLEDVFMIVNESNSFIPDSSRNGNIILNLTYIVEDLDLASEISENITTWL